MSSWKDKLIEDFLGSKSRLQWGHDDVVVEADVGLKSDRLLPGSNGATTMSSWKVVAPCRPHV
jgi:hypothetical protein